MGIWILIYGGIDSVCSTILSQDFNWNNYPEAGMFDDNKPQPTASISSCSRYGWIKKQLLIYIWSKQVKFFWIVSKYKAIWLFQLFRHPEIHWRSQSCKHCHSTAKASLVVEDPFSNIVFFSKGFHGTTLKLKLSLINMNF